jgi:fatty acid desaturase
VDRRRLWLRLVFLEVVLLGTQAVFVFFESWLIRMNLETEGLFRKTLDAVLSGEWAVCVVVLVGTATVGVAGVLYAWSAERPTWPYVLVGLMFLAFALAIMGARPSREMRERALAVEPAPVEQLLR